MYDRNVPWREFLVQFELVAHINGWEGDGSSNQFEGKSALSFGGVRVGIRFPGNMLKARAVFWGQFQNYYLQFINRKQKYEEDYATLEVNLERLARLAYPECEIWEKVACAQFIAALSDRFVKRIF